MIPILTKHLTEHHAEYDTDTYHFVCRCGARWIALREDYDAQIAKHAAHVAATFQAALDAAGATTRTEWGVEIPSGTVCPVVDESEAHNEWLRTERAFDIRCEVVSRTVVTMPWQPAEEVEA